jgi:hypothetical protein
MNKEFQALYDALKAIIQPDNGRKIEFNSAKQYYIAQITGGELDRANEILKRVEERNMVHHLPSITDPTFEKPPQPLSHGKIYINPLGGLDSLD